MLTELKQTQESAPECGAAGWQVFRNAEHTVLRAWKSSLASTSMDVNVLKSRRAAFAMIFASRPSLAEFMNRENVIEKSELLRVLRAKADPNRFVERPPCWREFYSWPVMIAKSLNQVDNMTRLVLELQGSTKSDGSEEWEKLSGADVHFRTQGNWFLGTQGRFESAELTLWALARAATAVALFRLEKGRDPGSLSELVPLYLREIPVTFPSGDRIEFQGSAVLAGESKDVGAEPWHLLGR
jgi:hypothetical protein